MTTAPLPTGSFDLLLADPPWRYDWQQSRARQRPIPMGDRAQTARGAGSYGGVGI